MFYGSKMLQDETKFEILNGVCMQSRKKEWKRPQLIVISKQTIETKILQVQKKLACPSPF